MPTPFTPPTPRAVLAAAVALAVALLGTFAHIVQEAAVAGPNRYLQPPNPTTLAKGAPRVDRAGATR